jgi:hypothetical protein
MRILYGWEMRRLSLVVLMPIVPLVSKAGFFNPEQTRAICDAFDQAWASLIEAESALIDPAIAPAAREILAKRIIDMAENGMLDVNMLRNDALAYLRDHPPG